MDPHNTSQSIPIGSNKAYQGSNVNRFPLSSSWKSPADNDAETSPVSPISSQEVSQNTRFSQGGNPQGNSNRRFMNNSSPASSSWNSVQPSGNQVAGNRSSTGNNGSFPPSYNSQNRNSGTLLSDDQGNNNRFSSVAQSGRSSLAGQYHSHQNSYAEKPKLTAVQLEEYSARAEIVVKASKDSGKNVDLPGNPLKYTWSISYTHRKPGAKIDDYNDTIVKVASIRTVEEFWGAYSRLKRPNDLPPITEYHFFKHGIQPIWEDNIHGGKWIIRLKKGISSRLWENLLLAIIGEQFKVGDEICGAVISIRQNEDILSLWTLHAENDENENEEEINENEEEISNKAIILKIRETLKKVLNLPDNCIMQYKAHKAAVVDHSSFRNTETFK